MNTFQTRRTLPTLALVASLAAGAGVLLHQSTTASPPPSVKDGARELSNAFRDVARNISPSVVSVLATHEAEDSGRRLRGSTPEDPFGERFFFRFFGDDDFPRQMQPPVMKGQGTGVIVDESGI